MASDGVFTGSAVVSGEVYPAGTTQALAATLTVNGGMLEVRADGRCWPVPAGARISEQLAGVPRSIALADGDRFVTTDHAGLANLLKAARHRNHGSRIAWLEGRGPLTIGLMVLVTIGFLIGLRHSIPAISTQVAAVIPPSAERMIGENAMLTLDQALLSPTDLPEAEQRRLRLIFDRLKANSTVPASVTLEFRKGGDLGANALALPGGPVLITDELVKLLPTDHAIAGVLGHELGHIEHRHSLQRLVRSSLWLATIMVYIGDETGVQDLLGGSVFALIDSGYSRDDEREADDDGVRIATAAGYSQTGLADAFDAMLKDCGPSCAEASVLSSHPGLTERINKLREGQSP